MSEAARETSCDWTVTGMDCGSCATKIKDAVARLPGVSGVEVGIMTERLRLTLDEAQTGRDKIEKTVRALGYQIAPRAAGAKKDFVLPGAHDGHGHDDAAHEGHDHAGHDHGPKAAAAKRDDSGHGSPGHVHDDPADWGKRWYQTAKSKLVIFTALLLGAAWIIEYLAPEIGKWTFVAACLIGVAPVAQRAFAALRMGQPFTIESLMTIAAIGALFINAAEEAALVVFLFAVGATASGPWRTLSRKRRNWSPATPRARFQPQACLWARQSLSAPVTEFRPMARSWTAPRVWMKARSPAKACPRRAGREMRSLQAQSTPRRRCG
jgi:Cd2+/Zn2+-exporting ATPase